MIVLALKTFLKGLAVVVVGAALIAVAVMMLALFPKVLLSIIGVVAIFCVGLIVENA